MAEANSPLSVPGPWNAVASAYADELVPFFEAFSTEALRLADVRPGAKVVDVAAGPGTLSLLAARRGATVSAIDFSEAMLARLRERVEREHASVEVRQGDGMALPYPDRSFDAGFSMFGLMFFPDRSRGFSELFRVLAPGGRAVVSSWKDLNDAPLLGTVFRTLSELMPTPSGDGPRSLPLVDPRACRNEMEAAGFVDVDVRELSGTIVYESTVDMVDALARNSAPIVLLREKLAEHWPALRERWIARLDETLDAGTKRHDMPAWLTVGSRPVG